MNQPAKNTAILCALFAIALAILFVVVRSLEFSPVHVRAEPSPDLGSESSEHGIDRVLMVHSYHAGYPWTDTITRGVRMALTNQRVTLKIFYMDTKRHAENAWKAQAGAKARQVIAEWRPAVIIAVDDNAQEYLAKDYAQQKNGPAVVFCGVNADPQRYDYPAPNVTGVLERPHFKPGLEMLSRLAPDASRLAIITDDSPTSAGALRYMDQAPAPWHIVSCETPRTWGQWRLAVERSQASADAIAIYMYHTVQSPDSDVSMDPGRVMAWTAANSGIPILGFFSFTVDDGAICSYLESSFQHGYEAGRLTMRILNGARPADIAISTALKGKSMINLDAARRWGIDVPEAILNDTDIVVE